MLGSWVRVPAGSLRSLSCDGLLSFQCIISLEILTLSLPYFRPTFALDLKKKIPFLLLLLGIVFQVFSAANTSLGMANGRSKHFQKAHDSYIEFLAEEVDFEEDETEKEASHHLGFSLVSFILPQSFFGTIRFAKHDGATKLLSSCPVYLRVRSLLI